MSCHDRPELLISLGKLLASKIKAKEEFRGETSFTISTNDLREVAKFCRDELSFDYLLDITSVDNFGEDPRFEVVYELYSMTLAVHLRLKLTVSEEVEVPTVSDIWPTANWHEREVYDMMGLKFTGHPDLRRILMWDGYPLLSASKRVSVGRVAERHARRRLFRIGSARGRALCHVAEHGDDEGPRTSGAKAARFVTQDRIPLGQDPVATKILATLLLLCCLAAGGILAAHISTSIPCPQTLRPIACWLKNRPGV